MTGGMDPPERSQKKVFLAILAPIPWKIAKPLGQNSMLDHHSDASEAPFEWRFPGGPMMARFKWYFDNLSSHQLKNIVKVRPALTKVSGSAHDWGVNYQLK